MLKLFPLWGRMQNLINNMNICDIKTGKNCAKATMLKINILS